MEGALLNSLIAMIAISIIFLVLIFLFVRIYFSVENEKRIKAFALDSKDYGEVSIADTFLLVCYRLIKMVSKPLKKSRFANDYATKFEKYLIYEDKNTFAPLDYISMKIIIMIFIQILYIFSIAIKFLSFKFPVFMLISIIAFMALDIVLIIYYRQKKSLIEEQLLQAVVIMNNAFKSGKNIMQAIDIVTKELPSPIKEEFLIIHTDLACGLDITTVFERFYNRVKLEEAKYITASLSLLRKTGGSIVTVFNMIERHFYDRLKIKNELHALTASSKYLYRILLFIPFIFILIIVMLNPSYFAPLVSTKIGFIIDALIAFLYSIYIIVIKKVMKVDEV